MKATPETPPGLTINSQVLDQHSYLLVVQHIRDEFEAIDCDMLVVEVARGTKKPKRRRTAIHYGPQFDYTTNHVKDNPVPIPKWMQPVVDALPVAINQATLQYYPPGAGIPPHVDTHSCFNTHIISYLVGQPVAMEFKRATDATAAKMFAPRRVVGGPTKEETPPPVDMGGETIEIMLEDNSLCVMEGEVRYAWTHAIRSRATDIIDGVVVGRGNRFSITFRMVDFSGVCQCSFPKWCDSQRPQPSS